MCECEVCQSLAGIRVELIGDPEELTKQLPETVRRILAAQERVRHHRPEENDVEIVKQAAARCTGGRFQQDLDTH